ncbi:FbpB family small basic protein [Alkalihalobacillus trypoxylicola]|nr:FbpB family small basic protein [Alkalihalobacillus trypoxylicola]GAF66789.1 hypothetical protein BTS2_3693 [Bacillus sp. TS-2]
MRKIRTLSFAELVKENKEEIMNDQEKMEQLEKRFEERHQFSK